MRWQALEIEFEEKRAWDQRDRKVYMLWKVDKQYKGQMLFCCRAPKHFIKPIIFSLQLFLHFLKLLFLNSMVCCNAAKSLVCNHFSKLFLSFAKFAHLGFISVSSALNALFQASFDICLYTSRKMSIFWLHKRLLLNITTTPPTVLSYVYTVVFKKLRWCWECVAIGYILDCLIFSVAYIGPWEG